MLYITYAVCSYEQTGDIINFSQFELGGLLEKWKKLDEDEPTSASIDKSSADDSADNKSISTDDLEDIWDGSYIHPNINARDVILKIFDHIRQ